MIWPNRFLPRFARRSARRAPPPRPGYILHYHIYKNAGSSIDRLLAESFAGAWVAFDPGPRRAPARIADLRAFRAEHPEVRAISSHSTCLAWPGLPDPAACPIVMLRHPACRVRSMHAFARRDPAQPDHALAQGSLRDYVEFRLADPSGQCGIANYQVAHLSKASLRCPAPWFAEPGVRDLRHAKALLSQWPAFGLVARFAQSMRAFQAAYAGRAAGLRLYEIRENASQYAGEGNGSRPEPPREAEEIEAARGEMGTEIFARFVDCNQLDLALYGFSTTLFNARIAALGPIA